MSPASKRHHTMPKGAVPVMNYQFSSLIMSITPPCWPQILRNYSRMTKSQLSSPQKLPLAGCPNKNNSKRAGDDGKREKALHAVPART